MDILDKLVASSMDLHNPVPHNINIYFDTLKERRSDEEFNKLIETDMEEQSKKIKEQHMKELTETNKLMDEKNNAVLSAEPVKVPFVDLIF
jgi:hypothetical protein